MSRESVRRAERHVVRFKVVFDDGVSYSAGYVENVSTTGIFLETADPLPLGTVVRFVPADAKADALFEVEGRVVRCFELDPDSVQPSEQDGAYGIGFELIAVDEAQQSNILLMIDEIRKHSELRDANDPYLAIRDPSAAKKA
ncbi:PilZ domain-containing protein [Myxococcota bacterium]|nr:PilZ domain-containing protein [Myxococcota bacterium]